MDFNKLNTLDLTKQVKAIQGNRYLPWNVAWAELCKIHPNATYKFHENSDGLPFFESKLGIFVKVSVTIDDLTHTMTRPVYDFRNLAMSADAREVQYGKNKVVVNAATANDINDSLMRCLTKAIAMFGLGLYIFQDKQYADAELINSEQISNISNLIAEKNLMLSDLNIAFGVNKISELMALNYERALQWIDENKFVAISDKQRQELSTLIDSTNTDVLKFKLSFKITKLSDLSAKDFDKAKKLLLVKQNKLKEK